MTFISVILVILTCIATSYLYYCRRKSIKTGLPGPKAFSLIGNVYDFLQGNPDGNIKKIKISLIIEECLIYKKIMQVSVKLLIYQYSIQ